MWLLLSEGLRWQSSQQEHRQRDGTNDATCLGIESYQKDLNSMLSCCESLNTGQQHRTIEPGMRQTIGFY